MRGNITNPVLFKLGWVACVLFAAAGEPMLVTLAVAAVVVAYLATVPVRLPIRTRESRHDH